MSYYHNSVTPHGQSAENLAISDIEIESISSLLTMSAGAVNNQNPLVHIGNPVMPMNSQDGIQPFSFMNETIPNNTTSPTAGDYQLSYVDASPDALLHELTAENGVDIFEILSQSDNDGATPMDEDEVDARVSETDNNYPFSQLQNNQENRAHAHTARPTSSSGAFDQTPPNYQVPADTQSQRGPTPVEFYGKESGGFDECNMPAESSDMNLRTSHVYYVSSSTAPDCSPFVPHLTMGGKEFANNVPSSNGDTGKQDELDLKRKEKRQRNKLAARKSRAKKKQFTKTVNEVMKEHAELLKEEKSLKQDIKRYEEYLQEVQECLMSILIEKVKPTADNIDSCHDLNSDEIFDSALDLQDDYPQMRQPSEHATNQAGSSSDHTTSLDIAVFQQGSTPTPQVPADTRVNGSGNGNENPWVVGHNNDDEDEEIFNFLKYHK